MIQDTNTRQWAMFLHLSQLAGFVIPFAGLIAPIVIWQVKKDEMPELDVHGRMVANWIISELIYIAISVVLSFVIIGIFLLFILGILAIVFPVIGGLKANDGHTWKYPLSLRIL